MFERTLTDVVKGIRASKRDTALYISQCIAEIKTEIASNDLYVKTNALQKLTFLQMLGYSMSWASFATIEVMSSPRFGQKRIGYLAASQGFTQDTEVILLTTNLLKKELRGAVGGGMNGVYEAGLAINCISNIVTEDLAQDLLPELTGLMNHPQPYLRKKAILCLFKVFMKYPQGLRLTFHKLQQALQDPNPSVVSCAVNVITELSDKNPKNYLHLAPAFFQLLTTSSNNWMLIKVVKLLGSLVPEEPRLARKLLEPLATIVRNTQAKSLLYEAVYTITLCLPFCRKADGSMPAIVPEIVQLCAKTLGSFVEESDQNLKYLGLVGFASLMLSHPKVLSASEYRPLILACLSDQDVTIRRRALDLLIGMTSRKNLMELVEQLLKHVQLASGSYRNDLVAKIIELCSTEKYSLLTDFGWYFDVLLYMGHLRGIDVHGDLLRAQITDVTLRVLPIRPYAVKRSMVTLLERNSNPSNDPGGDNGRGRDMMVQILPALAWIVGEYSDLIQEVRNSLTVEDHDAYLYDSSSKGYYHALLQVLTRPSNSQVLPSAVQKVYLQGAMKVLAASLADTQVSTDESNACIETIASNLSVFTQGTDIEVAERSFTALQLLDSLGMGAHPAVAPTEKDSDILEFHGATHVSSASSSVLKDASGLLNYLFKPSPMRPIGSKALKKKHASPAGHSVDLVSPLNTTVFAALIVEEQRYRSKVKLGLESVSFTQQQAVRIEDSHSLSLSTGNATDGSLKDSSQHALHAAATSFQHTGEPGRSSTASLRQGDPFYLVSTKPAELQAETQGPESRFGTIQLSDSDEAMDPGRRSLKKEKKKKKKERRLDGSSVAGMKPVDDFWTDSGFGQTHPSVIHESDSDAGDDVQTSLYLKKKGLRKEFSGLARVDLTTPLREDEVMPVQRHRVVPDPSTEEKPAKKEKKTKKNKKGQRSAGKVETEDLLDLAGFAENSNPPAPHLIDINIPKNGTALVNTTLSSSGTNAIDTAFNDLLGLSLGPSSPQPVHQIMSGTQQKYEAHWLRGSLKASSAVGQQIDWSRIMLSYSVLEEDLSNISIKIRLENQNALSVPSLLISLADKHVEVPNVASGTWKECGKLGPYETRQERAFELKGSIKAASGDSIRFKISVPFCIRMKPDYGLTLDKVAEELSTPSRWFSFSSKIKITSNIVAGQVFDTIASFLRACEVGERVGDAATFASRMSGGCLVRVLVKVEGRILRAEIRSTNSDVGESLAADLKRLLV